MLSKFPLAQSAVGAGIHGSCYKSTYKVLYSLLKNDNKLLSGIPWLALEFIVRGSNSTYSRPNDDTIELKRYNEKEQKLYLENELKRHSTKGTRTIYRKGTETVHRL